MNVNLSITQNEFYQFLNQPENTLLKTAVHNKISGLVLHGLGLATQLKIKDADNRDDVIYLNASKLQEWKNQTTGQGEPSTINDNVYLLVEKILLSRISPNLPSPELGKIFENIPNLTKNKEFMLEACKKNSSAICYIDSDLKKDLKFSAQILAETKVIFSDLKKNNPYFKESSDQFSNLLFSNYKILKSHSSFIKESDLIVDDCDPKKMCDEFTEGIFKNAINSDDFFNSASYLNAILKESSLPDTIKGLEGVPHEVLLPLQNLTSFLGIESIENEIKYQIAQNSQINIKEIIEKTLNQELSSLRDILNTMDHLVKSDELPKKYANNAIFLRAIHSQNRQFLKDKLYPRFGQTPRLDEFSPMERQILLQDKELALLMINKQYMSAYALFKYLDPSLKKDKDVVRAALTVSQDATVLALVDESLKKDLDLMIEALKLVRAPVGVVQYADSSLKSNNYVLLFKLLENGTPLNLSLCFYEQYGTRAIKQQALKENNKTVIIALIKGKLMTVDELPDELQKDPEIRQAVK